LAEAFAAAVILSQSSVMRRVITAGMYRDGG